MSLFRPAVAACALSLSAAAVHAQTTPVVSPLAAFSISNPSGNLVRGDDGALYGVAAPATSVTGGLIYRIAVDGSSIETLFQIPTAQAVQPQAGLTLASDGFFYGTTRFGGTESTTNTGTVFRISQAGTDFTVIHRFAASTASNADFNPVNTQGAQPEAELTEGSDGYLYGVAVAGGPNGTGAVFKVSRDGTDFAVLHTFAADTDTTTSGLVVTVDGAAPRGPLVEGADGWFYGTASAGGANGRGTVFRVRPDGTAFEVLHTFSATTNDATTGQPENADGAIPTAGLVSGGDGTFYGVTSVGGTEGLGVVFAISPDGATYTVLHHFDGPTGARPVAELLLGDDGRLYGAAAAGGLTSTNTASTLGTLFAIDRAGTGFTRLHSFEAAVGASPASRLVQLGEADFVGTLIAAGRCGYGGVFRYSGAGATFTGDTTCGRRGNNDGGGGHFGPALLLVLGALGWRHRRRRD